METKLTHWDTVSRCLKGDEAALNFLQHYNFVANVWDDLIDGDIQGTDPRVSRAFETALVHIPRNQFYQAYRNELQPVMEVAISNWHAANHFQASPAGEDHLVKAHMLRFSGVDVFLLCARLIGGMEWANQCAIELRKVYPSETLADFTNEVTQ